MKLSLILAASVAASASNDDKKVPPRHPLQRLKRLTQFSEEIISQWFTFVPSHERWIQKFSNNAARMERNFKRGNQRCGFYDAEQLPHGGPESDARKRRDAEDDDEVYIRYNREDPEEGIKQITTGYRKWAERYLSQCSGQREHQYQVDRMNRWVEKFHGYIHNEMGDGPETEDSMLHTCSSWNFADAECVVSKSNYWNKAEINKQNSKSDCTEGESWGFDKKAQKIWVKDSCRAQFRLLKTTWKDEKMAISCEWHQDSQYGQMKAQGSQLANPTCPDGKVVNITDAKYGRWSDKVCAAKKDRHNRMCGGYADHTAAAAQACDGKGQCNFHGNNKIAQDPCRGITKYTVVKYTCVDN